MSIFKESFPNFVKKQLEQRETTIASGAGKKTDISGSVSFNFNEDRSNSFFQYQQKQCILRLSSGVDISDPKILEENKSGAEIAKNWVLEAGIKDGNTNRGGIGSGGAYGDSDLRSEADDGYGIVPMPGITSANIRTKSAYGSLREGKVSFVCHNRRQLEVLELLYMRPGYTLLLEWQWSPFIDNDGNVDNITVKKVDFFNKNKTFASMEQDIEQYKEETGGNYDALIGYCKNFSYKLRADGGFDCETEIIAKGEVLESLKDKDTTVKIADPYGENVTARPNLEIFLADLVAFNNAVTGVGGLAQNEEGATQVDEGISDDQSVQIQADLSKDLAVKIGVEAPDNYNLSPYILTGGPSSFTDWGDTLGIRDEDERGDWADWEGGWSLIGLGRRFRTNTTWVRWDALCYYINNFVVPLNEQNEPIMSFTTAYLSHPDESGEVYLEPLMYSSKKRATKFIRDKIQTLTVFDVEGEATGGTTVERAPDEIYWITDISVNNQICMLPHNLYQYKDAPKYSSALDDMTVGDFDEQGKLLLKAGIMKTSFHKPLVKTLTDKNAFNFKSGKGINRTWKDSDAFSQNNIGGIYFGAEYLLSTFRGVYYDGEGNINKDYTLFDFVKKIWEEVNSCTQNGHDFDIQTDNRGGCSIVRIIDRQMDNSGDSIKDVHELKIQSLDSIVRDVTYNTTIPSSLSTTIAVAAQSPNSVDDLDKVSFAALNKGIKDRFAVSTTTDTTPSNDQIEKWSNRFSNELIKIHGALYLQGGKYALGQGGSLINLLYREYQSNRNYILKEDMQGISPKNTSTFKGALANVIKALNYFQTHYGSTNESQGYYRGQPAEDGAQPLSSIIPLKFNALLDGISGIVIGNVFKLPKDRLPMAYAGNDIHFIVMGEEQEINANQDWTTTISGHLILLGNVSSEEYKKSKHFKSWQSPDLNISQNAYFAVKTQGQLSVAGPAQGTALGSLLAGTIVGSMLGNPLESISINGDNVFGEDRGVYGPDHPKAGQKRIHKGVDLAAESGAILYAVADGTVEFAGGGYRGWGGAIKIKFDTNPLTGEDDWSDPKHKNTTPQYALYAHVKKWWKGDLTTGRELVKGDKVKKGESIGLSGGAENDPHKGNSQGAHLHFEMYLADGKTKIDPMPWIPGGSDFWEGAADEGDGALGTNIDQEAVQAGQGQLEQVINQTPVQDAVASGKRGLTTTGEIFFIGWPGDGSKEVKDAENSSPEGSFLQTGPGGTEDALGGYTKYLPGELLFGGGQDLTWIKDKGRYVLDGISGRYKYYVKLSNGGEVSGFGGKKGIIVSGKFGNQIIDKTKYVNMVFPEFQHYTLSSITSGFNKGEWHMKKVKLQMLK